MKPNNKIFDYILITLAIFSISYFILLILNSRFITSYILYLIFACICILYSYYELKNKTSILSKLPKIINYIIKGLICISIILFIIIEGLIINEANNSYCKQTDFVIVLGAKLNGAVPSTSLKYRLDATLEYYQQFPETTIIVSGGQGNGENISEAKAMKQYLIDKGINKNSIIEENKSTNTKENIIYSKKIMDSLKKEKYTVTIITNNFHCYRSKLLANKNNLTAYTYSAKQQKVLIPHYYIREFFGCLKDIIFS